MRDLFKVLFLLISYVAVLIIVLTPLYFRTHTETAYFISVVLLFVALKRNDSN